MTVADGLRNVSTSDDFARNEVRLRVEPILRPDIPFQPEGFVHLASYVPIPETTGLDAGWWPWLTPDPNPMPYIEFSPRLDRALERTERAVWRVRMAWRVLRHGTDPEET